MAEGLTVAVVGASGLVGREMVAQLLARRFPVRELRAVASPRSAGRTIEVGGRRLVLRPPDAAALAGVDLVLMSAGSAASRDIAPRAAAAGAAVVDNGSTWRQHADVPLVIPEVNAPALAQGGRGHIVASPNCAAIQILLAVAPLHRACGLTRLTVATYQAASGRGKAGRDELAAQLAAQLAARAAGDPAPAPGAFPRRLALHCVPQVGPLSDAGDADEELKLVAEARKILALPGLPAAATCVRVPVHDGHAAAVHLGLAAPLTPAAARDILAAAPAVRLGDGLTAAAYPTTEDLPAARAADDAVLVGRVRADASTPHGIALWCVADNLRRGAAVNAVGIAEALLARGQLAAR